MTSKRSALAAANRGNQQVCGGESRDKFRFERSANTRRTFVWGSCADV